MSDRLHFGTAGLRAALGEGPLRMNDQVVSQAATAIGRWLPPGSVVVIGADARHGSEEFANVTARILAEAGHEPRLFDQPVPTPVVAWAVGDSDAAAGVMVTASHNPATDNGYKVYSADGGQILPPDAEAIEAIIETLEWPESVDTARPPGLTMLGDDEIDGYVAAIERPTPVGSLTIVYTAMHGVGGALIERVLGSAGHEVHPVPEQQQPDPDFPTAAFPNPEEPGTLDLAMALAADVDAEMILANDPDADRLAVAVPRDGTWERLTGDQIGVLLGWFLLGQTEGERAVVTTIVSSSMLGKVAAAAGAKIHTVLTGFKWLARSGDDEPDVPLIFGYEEALGYSVNLSIRDKDGISAALVFCEMVAQLREHGHTVDDVLDNLYAIHGVHVTSQVSQRFDGDDAMDRMSAAMTRVRSDPPTEVGGLRVLHIDDLIHGGRLPPSDVLIYALEGGRLIIRPSGTEPKVKAYVEAVAGDRSEADLRRAQLEDAARHLLAG
ncbi:MAG: phospho-sugar mutase [Acidimicrobiales bacterium]